MRYIASPLCWKKHDGEVFDFSTIEGGGNFMYKKVELKNGFVGMENEVADYWKKNYIIKKNFDMN